MIFVVDFAALFGVVGVDFWWEEAGLLGFGDHSYDAFGLFLDVLRIVSMWARV